MSRSCTHVHLLDVEARAYTCRTLGSSQVREGENNPDELGNSLLRERDARAVVEPSTLKLIALLWPLGINFQRVREVDGLN